MTVHNGVSRRSREPGKGKYQLQDDSIMGTNNSSIVSKRSVERLYYPNEPHFFRYFVKKPQRRSPLINRGYWLRMRAVDKAVRQFLKQESSKPKVVINLGCGYDPIPWQCLVRYPAQCKGVKFVDVDYKDLMIKKRDIVRSTEELNSLLTNMEVLDGNILLRSSEYLQLGCDLRDLKTLEETIASAIDIENCLILFTAEVSITYMNVEAADALIGWAGKLPNARFCLLEQILPNGIDHPFARTMMAHFNQLQTQLRAATKYPTTSAQEKRFINLGWSSASAQNLWRLWNDPDFVTSQERISLDILEPFDEWEEFALFGCHYFLLVADNTATSDVGEEIFSCADNRSASQDVARSVEIEMAYSENPKAQGCRRFAAVLPLRGPTRTEARVGVFGGMGLNSRMNTYDVYATDQSVSMSSNSLGTALVPPSRMCHTITDIGEAGALLVGGRTSPDSAFADCWLYHKWLDTWERVDDLPRPQYRQGAVNLGQGHVLICPGKSNSRDISKDFYVWSRALGWIKCIQGPGGMPRPSYGATFTVFEGSLDASGIRCGFLAGGISEDGLFLEEIWEWELHNFSGQEPIIAFKHLEETRSGIQPLTIARFGASVVNHQGQTWVIGGIFKAEILTESTEICLVDRQGKVSQAALSRTSISAPRPLLIGSSVVSMGNSLLVVGGSAVCFSFGTSWNNGCYTLRTVGANWKRTYHKLGEYPMGGWKFLHTVAAAKSVMLPIDMPFQTPVGSVTGIPRMKVGSSVEFDQILLSARPAILGGLDLGPCTDLWTSNYLKEHIGADREVIVHDAATQYMDFQSKNFTYSTKSFGEFIDQVDTGKRLYLRSLSSEKPAELPANIVRDFPSLSKDFRLPPELALVKEHIHSCPLRISGPVIMWLHYDVMANVLCQIRGSKRLLLFPPSDVKHLGFEAGASSSSINVFENQTSISANTHPHEALLNPGDVLFLPPLWLHAASPTSGMSIAVNVFFRNLQSGYAAGKDVYGNRDLQAYEKGRQDIARIIKSFDSLPADIRGFYLQRLAKELQEKAC